MENSKKRILTYGSLRKNEYNFDRFKAIYGPNFNYLSSIIIKGYDLYDLGSYPGIKESENPNKDLQVDIMECGDDCYNSIKRMELGAGYTTKNIEIDGEDHTIYIYQGNPRKLVESGDWSKYLHEKKLVK